MLCLPGGVESMGVIPMGGNTFAPNPYLMENDSSAYTTMGITAENVAEMYNITREMQDKLFQVESHKKAAIAQSEGKFDEDIIPIKSVKTVKDGSLIKSETFIFDLDEDMRKYKLFKFRKT